ncbi:hypothetical protein [Anaplasma phagocytophilum]
MFAGGTSIQSGDLGDCIGVRFSIFAPYIDSDSSYVGLGAVLESL